jgi:hypothetical protein
MRRTPLGRGWVVPMNAVDATIVQPDASRPPSTATGRAMLRRWGEGIVFAATWTGLGWSLGIDANAYLLLGVPLTIAFQRYVRGEPLRAMWVREAPPLGRWWIVPTAVLGILPAVSLVGAIVYRRWIIGGWMLAAVGGSVGAGYALMHLRRSAMRPFLMCQLTAGAMGIGLAIAARAMAEIDRPPLLQMGLHDFLLYLPACFALEEVSFRGALDAHLHRPGERFPLTSALLGSILWGLWHLPTLPVESRVPEAVIAMLGVHVLIGVPLAIYWRRSGNLAVPAFTHAMIDAVRNALEISG